MENDNHSSPSQHQRASVQVSLKSNGHPVSPVLANLTSVTVAQGIAHIEFGFVEPALLDAIARRTQQAKPLHNGIQGALAARVALPLAALLRLQQQLNQVLLQLQTTKQAAS